MRKILLFAVLLLTLTLLPTVPIVAKKPPPTEERYYVTFTGDIESDRLELMSQRASGKGGKHLALLTPQTCLHPGKQCTPQVEYTTLTFVGLVWKDWADTTHDDGKIRLSINLKFNEVGMIYFFDYEQNPLDFWRLKETDEGIGEWIPDDGKDEGEASFVNARFELWKYSAQGDITYLDLTFDVTIEPIP